MKKLLLAMMLFVASSLSVLSQGGSGYVSPFDTVHVIDAVEVTRSLTYRETMPAQTLKGVDLERLNTHSVADALRYFSGLQLKDYGGVGGLKTVNIRSMGTNHLGIYYDGIELGNAQNGQIDLGQFSLDNVEEISLYNGQKSAIFQTASDFGNAGSIYIRTRMPRFAEGETFHLKANAKVASSDTYRFSALYEQRLGERLRASVSGEALTSSGRYKFRYRRLAQDRSVAYDTTAVRHNGDIWALRGEANIYGTIDEGYWRAKVYTYHSERGIPGAIVNNVWRRGERQWDHNTFAQGQWQRSFGERFSTRLLAKYAYYETHYQNNDTTQMMVDNTYKQQELYFSNSNVLEILPNWSASLSYDFRYNTLDCDQFNFVEPYRFSNLVSLATAVDFDRLKMQGSVMGSFVKDHTRKSVDRKAVKEYAPAFFVSYVPVRGWSLRAYAKRSFRMPTFNDLFYTQIGNALLKPEIALQYNAGGVWQHRWAGGVLKSVRVQADAYYNSVHNKIVAYPKGQQFRWTMLNLGRVHIKGVDVEAEVAAQPVNGLVVTSRLQYTYQDARDVTNRNTSYYNDQIPYIPWHSGSAILNAQWRRWDFTYSFIYAGERYNQQENIRFNHMQPWYTSDLSLMYHFPWHRAECKLTLEVNNVFSQDYDVILNYPMPKRNYAVSMQVTL